MWILSVILFNTAGVSSFTQEYRIQETCETALSTIKKDIIKAGSLNYIINCTLR